MGDVDLEPGRRRLRLWGAHHEGGYRRLAWVILVAYAVLATAALVASYELGRTTASSSRRAAGAAQAAAAAAAQAAAATRKAESAVRTAVRAQQLTAVVQAERRAAILGNCRAQNARNHRTLARLYRLVPRKLRGSPQVRGSVLLINALQPHQDCEALVRRQAGSITGGRTTTRSIPPGAR